MSLVYYTGSTNEYSKYFAVETGASYAGLGHLLIFNRMRSALYIRGAM